MKNKTDDFKVQRRPDDQHCILHDDHNARSGILNEADITIGEGADVSRSAVLISTKMTPPADGERHLSGELFADETEGQHED